MRFQAMELFFMAGTYTAIGRDPELPGFDGDISLYLRNLSHFSGHNKTSMIIAEKQYITEV